MKNKRETSRGKKKGHTKKILLAIEATWYHFERYVKGSSYSNFMNFSAWVCLLMKMVQWAIIKEQEKFHCGLNQNELSFVAMVTASKSDSSMIKSEVDEPKFS